MVKEDTLNQFEMTLKIITTKDRLDFDLMFPIKIQLNSF